MNNSYEYDASFLGLLSLIKYLLKGKIKPYNIIKDDYQVDLFTNIIKVKVTKDEKVMDFFVSRFGSQTMHYVYYVFLSSYPNKEIVIYYYLLNYLKYGPKVIYKRDLKCVRKVLELNKKVGNEAHKLKGFVRFRELKSGILYAEINPDNDILELLAKHFMNRLKNEYWVIKDVRRKIICIYDTKKIYVTEEDNLKIIDEVSKNEIMFKDMWQDFYHTIAIKMRKNDRCRLNFMPKKYWPYIVEMEDER